MSHKEDVMTDKSYVGMSTCFFCGEPKEILLDKRLRNTLPREACYDHEPCDKCREYMKQGIIVISVNEACTTDRSNPYRSGGWWVVTEDFIKRITKPGEFLDNILKKRFVFMPDEVCDHLGLKKGNVSND